MLHFGQTLYALIFSTSLIYNAHCQPINTETKESEKPASVGMTDNKKENETASPAFTYNYPTGFPRDFDSNPFR